MASDYSQEKLESLLSDPSFRDWILFNKDAEKWEFWTLEDKNRAKIVDEARLILQSLRKHNVKYTDGDIENALRHTWGKIKLNPNRGSRKSISKKILYAAAAVTILFSFLLWGYNSSDLFNLHLTDQVALKNEEGLIEHYNNSNKALLITLSDGSSVLLQPKSKLSYPKIFPNNERNVFLSGEAFFEVSKDPKKLFSVYANEITTKVYGTSFRVVAYKEQPNVEVLVRTGKVTVSSPKIKDNKIELVLLPNQAARYTKKESLLEKIEDITQNGVLSSKPSSIEKLSFEFNDITVGQIFKTLEQAYLVEIEYPKEVLENCFLTTSLNDLTLTEKLKIICESIGNNSTYSITGNYIRIFSKGCN